MNDALRQAGDVARGLTHVRGHLYVLFVAFNLFVVVAYLYVGVFMPPDAVEPLWRWLPAVIAVMTAGLSVPGNLHDFAAKFPLVALGVTIILIVLKRWNTSARVAARECDSQSFLLLLGVKQVIDHPRWWLQSRVTGPLRTGLLLGTGAIVALVGIDTIPSASAAAILFDVPSAEARPCADTRGDCLLRAGESVLVSVQANQPRNETGIVVKAGQRYTIRPVGWSHWVDGEIEGGPGGVDFGSNILGLPRFWWLRWRRPVSGANWFEVVGRVGHDRKTLPILDAPDRPKSFTATSHGELVLLVNDVPYGNNAGVMTVEIKRLGPTLSQPR